MCQPRMIKNQHSELYFVDGFSIWSIIESMVRNKKFAGIDRYAEERHCPWMGQNIFDRCMICFAHLKKRTRIHCVQFKTQKCVLLRSFYISSQWLLGFCSRQNTYIEISKIVSQIILFHLCENTFIRINSY